MGIIIIAAVLAILTALAFTRVVVTASYGDDRPHVKFRYLFVEKSIYPPSRTIKKAGKKTLEDEKPAKSGEKGREDPLDLLKTYYQIFLKAISNFFKILRIDLLQVRFVAADKENPAGAAIMYGRAFAVAGIIIGHLENNMPIKDKRISIEIDYSADSPTIQCAVKLSASVGRIVLFGSGVLRDFIINLLKSKGGASYG